MYFALVNWKIRPKEWIEMEEPEKAFLRAAADKLSKTRKEQQDKIKNIRRK